MTLAFGIFTGSFTRSGSMRYTSVRTTNECVPPARCRRRAQPIIAGLAEEAAQAPLDGIEALGAAGAIGIRQHVGHLGQPPIVLLERQRRAEPRVERRVQQLSPLALEVAVRTASRKRMSWPKRSRSGTLLPRARPQQLVERVHGTAAVA